MPKVLIVDDEPVICSYLEIHYKNEGFETFSVHNGIEALKSYKKNMPDLVVTDVKMPLCDGQDFVKGLNGFEKKPVILCMSAFSDFSMANAYELGIDAIFKKPFQIKDMLSASKRFLSVKEELKSLQLLKHEKDETDQEGAKYKLMSELSAGVTHNVNNHITCIVASSKIIQHHAEDLFERDHLNFSDLETVKKYVDKIHNHSMIMAKIIKSLRMLSSHKDNLSFDTVPLSIIVESALELASEQIKAEGICVSVNISDNIYISCQPEKTLQVFICLIQNSCEAIKHLDEKWIKIESQEIDQATEISFIDSGLGIPEEVRGKMMTPFYSTKPSGIGIGLSLSQKIMETQKGKLWLDADCKNTKFVALFNTANF